MADDISAAQVLPESPRLLAGADGEIVLPHLHVTAAEIRVRPGQLLAGRQGLENPSGFLGGPVGLLPTAQSPERGGKRAEVLSDAEVFAKLAPKPEGTAQRALRLLPPIKQCILARGALMQCRQSRPVTAAGIPQGALELRRGLPVCTQGGGAPGRLRRVPEHGPLVPGAFGVVREQRGIVVSALLH